MLDKTALLPLNIPVQPLDAAGFAPFGDVISANPWHMRMINNGTTQRFHDLARIETYGTDTSVLFNIFRGNPFSLPVDITMVERHPYGSQAFFPVEKLPYLVVVAQDRDGIPQQPQAFLARPGQGVNYRANVWHHPLLALEKVSDFIVVDRAGRENNLEEFFYDRPYRICSLVYDKGERPAMKAKTVTLKQLNTVPAARFCTLLSGIFEHSPWVAEGVVSRRPFASLDALLQSMVAEVARADHAKQMALICAHPDLAGKAAQQGTLTQESTHEQKGAGLDTLDDTEFAEFHQLNTAYRQRFGFPCIIAVRGFDKPHDKFSILADMRQRLRNTRQDEQQEALRQIARIAELRLKDLAGG